MKYYIFFTHEGFTITPEDHDADNCQILGLGRGHTVEEAFIAFKAENSILVCYGFNDVIAMELVNAKLHFFELNDLSNIFTKLPPN